MNRTDYLEKVKELIVDAEIADDADGIEENMSLKGDLKCDSLDITQLVANIEDEFDIDVPDRVLPTLRTVGDIVNYLEENAE